MKLTRVETVRLFVLLMSATTIMCLSGNTAHSGDNLPAMGGLADARVIIVRHAEKDSHGSGLSAAGKIRAQAYAAYFLTLKVGGRPLHIDSLVAATDTTRSARPRLTLLPLSLALGLSVAQPCSDLDPDCMLSWMGHRPPGQTTLIAWRHSKMAKLLARLGARPDLLPNGQWPSDSFDWIVVLKYDQSGHIPPDGVALIREPASVDDAVWEAMDHPEIHPLEEGN